ncbi:hypothetical protein M0813_14371 [Anaeramoeba flamelloides]|uniref:Uncharacterized protein n=1 Tax=Anaeramoeba flamelloides TaxID=1746091 RepID=A0ABQ8Z5Y5_9EUKA|nr:hypothetical protein M0813_14371 [Anaeramoeba flamelloides]
MNSRTKFVEKRFNITKQWEMRCQFSALNRELPEWKTILMENSGTSINLPQIISQYKKNLEKELLLAHEQDIIAQNVLVTKKKLYQIKYYLNSALIKLKEKVSKTNKVKDVINLNKKNEAFINLSVYINEFEKTFKIKKKPRRTKTLLLNQDEYNGDIEIFKEIEENEVTNGLVEENFQEKSVLNDEDLGEIEGILTSNRKKLNDLTDDVVFGISFDKRLPTSFTDNTLLFEIERNKNK